MWLCKHRLCLVCSIIHEGGRHMHTQLDQLRRALEEEKIVALALDPRTGFLIFLGAFTSDREAAERFSADSPEKMGCLPRPLFIKGRLHQLNPANNL